MLILSVPGLKAFWKALFIYIYTSDDGTNELRFFMSVG
jgi:hypothetical protein